jgi:TonB-linked SusC/RagA family outer membrane protein
MMKHLKMFCLGLCLLLSTSLFAQDRSVSGTVSDANGSAVPGASIKVKNSNKGTSSNVDGKFSLSVSANQTLVISAIGFSSQEVKVGNQSVVNVSLVEDISNLEEVIVTGLATNVKRTNSANAVSSISAKQLMGTTSPVTTDGAMYGKIAGANIQSNGSMPGGGFSVQLRGVSTLGSSASQPLFIIDGVYIDNSQNSNGRSQANKATGGSSASTQDNNPNRLADINPDDIENIEILKGSSAAAIYGTRANAGVVIITTKRGKGGKTKISFGQDLGVSQAISYYGGATWDEAKITENFPSELADYKAANGKSYDYEKELYGSNGKISNTRLSITGGDEKTKFYINGSLANETGITKNTGFTRGSIRANIDHKLNKWADVGVSTNFVKTNTDRGWMGNDNSNINIGYNLPYNKPWYNLYPNENGIYPDSPVGENPLAIRDRAVNDQGVNRVIQGAKVDLRLINREKTALTFKLNGGFDYQNGASNIWLPSDLQSQKAEANPGFAQDTRNEVYNNNLQGFLVLNQSVGKGLDLTSSVGLVRLSSNAKFAVVRGTGLPAGIYNPSAAKVVTGVINYSRNTDVGVVAQQDANWDDKLIASVGVRFDKSTLNGENNKFYAFPKASLAANLPKLLSFGGSKLNQLKLRVAYGATGGVPNFGTPFTSLVGSNVGSLGGLVVSTVGGNPLIQPENATEIEAGVDFGLFNNRVTGEFTVYKKKVFNLIQPLTLAPNTGVTSITTNLADMENKGIELSLGAEIIKKANFSWFVQPLFWLNRTNITRLDIPERLTGGFGATFGQWRIKNGQSPTEIVGQPRTNPADPLSWTVYGNQQPKFEMSLNQTIKFAKNFEFSVLGHWRHKFTVVSLARVLWDEGGNTFDWNGTDQSADAKVPNGIYRQNANGLGKQGYNPTTVSYLKIREAALYYRVPAAKLKTAFSGAVSGLKIGVSGNNLFVFDNYIAGYDTENSNFGSLALGSGVDIGSGPAVRRMMLHLAFDF